MEQWEHGTLIVSRDVSRGGNIQFLTAGDDETVDHESASARKVMNAPWTSSRGTAGK
jgi:hypothetical protein